MNERAEPRLPTADPAAVGRDAHDDRLSAREPDVRNFMDRPGLTDVTEPDNEIRDGSSPLFSVEEGRLLRTRWEQIQTGFVDEPKQAVENADVLVADTMKRLADVFSDERSELESQWTRGDDVSTEDLRLALRRYRSFFDRLLSV